MPGTVRQKQLSNTPHLFSTVPLVHNAKAMGKKVWGVLRFLVGRDILIPMMKRQRKQIIIIAIYTIVFLLVVGSIWAMFLPDPSCSDGKQNQNETGIDCGGVCGECAIEADDLEVGEVFFSEVDFGIYDVAALVENPNALFGSGSFSYTFEFLGKDGQVIREISGQTYILPSQERYIMEVNIAQEVEPADVRLRLGEVRWEKFTEYEAPSISVTNRSFERVSSGTMYAQARGLVRNESPYDFETVEVFVGLRDSSGRIIAIGRTDMQTVRAGERRDFIVQWPNAFEGSVASVDARATTNMFENQNFIKIFFPGGRFQSYE